MPRKQQQWLNIEMRPATPPTIEYNEIDGSYWISWDAAGLAVSVTEDELGALMTEAMIARAQASDAA